MVDLAEVIRQSSRSPEVISGLALMAGQDPNKALLQHAQAETQRLAVEGERKKQERQANLPAIMKTIGQMKPEEAYGFLVDHGFSDKEAFGIVQNMAALKAPAKRNIIKGKDGFNYYEDTQERVLPSVTAEPELPKTTGLPEGYMWQKNDKGKQVAVPIEGVTPEAKEFNKDQAASAGFARRMIDANEDLAKLEESGDSATGALWNIFQGKGEQQYLRSKEDFITAVLRKESGAAIGQDEFDKEDKKYFPQSFDSDEVIKAKREARKKVAEDIRLQSGGAYESFYKKKSTGATKEEKLKRLQELRAKAGR